MTYPFDTLAPRADATGPKQSPVQPAMPPELGAVNLPPRRTLPISPVAWSLLSFRPGHFLYESTHGTYERRQFPSLRDRLSTVEPMP